MPLVDMPLEKLKVYEGHNPIPTDIDEFWDRSIAEMEALGTGCELIEADFQVPGVRCYDLYFTGMGGARIHGRFARPDNDKKVPAVCHFHGYSAKGLSFPGLLGYVAGGFAAASLDVRGQAGNSEDVGGVKGNTLHGHIIRGLDNGTPDKLLFRDIFLDTAQLARIVMAMPDIDETRVGATGGSQGGGLTLACAALTPTLNRAAPIVPFLCDYKRVWEMDLDVDAYKELREYFRSFDPRHLHEEETWRLLGYIDNSAIAHRIRAKVRMFTSLMDTICPPSTQFAAYNRITSEKDVVIYPDYGHEVPDEAHQDIYQFMLEM